MHVKVEYCLTRHINIYIYISGVHSQVIMGVWAQVVGCASAGVCVGFLRLQGPYGVGFGSHGRG